MCLWVHARVRLDVQSRPHVQLRDYFRAFLGGRVCKLVFIARKTRNVRRCPGFGQVNYFFKDENEDFLKVMNSFSDLDQNAVIETQCEHYTHHLICSRKIFKILIGATKSS